MKNNLQAIILAAGKSSRFKTNHSKLLEKICGQEMILYITKLLSGFEVQTTVVVGYKRELVEATVKNNHAEPINFVHQEQQLGTGHALMCTQTFWERDHILVLNGDMPLVTADCIDTLYKKHIAQNADISFVVAHNIDPDLNSYGRVIQEGSSIKIIEAKDDTRENSEHCCINAGIYLFRKDFLEKNINEISKSKVTGELYITDLINIASKKGFKVETASAQVDIIRGINTLKELWAAEQIKRAEIIKHWMERGVRFAFAQNCHVDLNVKIEPGTNIGAGVQVYGTTTIDANCKIEAFSILDNAILQEGVTIRSHTIVKNSTIGKNSNVGPFAHIHTNTIVKENVAIGNFVEVKNSEIGDHSKAKHLSFLGDTQVGANTNIGAGTITCNYNGILKQRTIIKDNVFIGSNNCLIAPVTIGNNAFTAAGSVITENVPDYALAIARAGQINKEDYAKKLLDKNKQNIVFAVRDEVAIEDLVNSEELDTLSSE
ncbi:MAG: bifunctional UDP-N-acetylglucosamine diphosphorylase/glucosamine-1-phosphate N-acetyltransferase GlmU [Candidatus Babeliales bacterium]|nr:bifunctional UDP-N-acetylglucosamine diphosphorylase/glucosamine-1-phosphate N-acetyltransferase GlmU [Candidatus Babeliales bacterium]